MLHPLLHLIASRPQLLGEHAGAYAELVGTELDKATQSWKSRLALYTGALFLLTAGTVFTGVALMLWAVVPVGGMPAPWVLVAVPMVPLLAGVLCIFRARAAPKYPTFDTLKQQITADLAMLREVSAP